MDIEADGCLVDLPMWAFDGTPAHNEQCVFIGQLGMDGPIDVRVGWFGEDDYGDRIYYTNDYAQDEIPPHRVHAWIGLGYDTDYQPTHGKPLSGVSETKLKSSPSGPVLDLSQGNKS